MIIGQHLSPPRGRESYEEAVSPFPTIIIDAGHGGEDGGAVGVNGVYEKDINLHIAKLLDQMLRAAGYPTLMTRTEDILLYDRNEDYEGRKKVLDLAARLAVTKEQETAIFVSIHMNSFPQAQYRGLQVYHSPNDSRSIDLANQIQTLTRSLLMPQNDRSIKPSGGRIYLLDRCTIPAVMVECGFLSNPAECELLSTEAYQRKLAVTLFAAITEYLAKENHTAT